MSKFIVISIISVTVAFIAWVTAVTIYRHYKWKK